MAICWPLQMPPTPKAVLISLADNANDHGECWPSIAHICERTCLGKTAVINAIKWLEVAGVLLADRDNGRHSRYTIDLRRIDQGQLFREEPVRETNRYARQTGTADAPDRTARRTAPVREADTNRKEPSRTVKRDSAQTVDVSFWPSQPSPQVLADWIAHRKAKRAPLTETVLRAFGREIAKVIPHGFDADAVLAKCMNRNWQGFEAGWLLREIAENSRAGPAGQPQSKTLTAMQKIQGMKHGLAGNRTDERAHETGVPRLAVDTSE
jgi:hypothetical protein